MIRVIKSQHSPQRLLLHFHLVVLSNLHRKQHEKPAYKVARRKIRYESKEAKDSPTDETQIKHEQLHLIAIHHNHALFDSCIVFHFGFFLQNIRCHRIRIVFNDAGIISSNDHKKV